MLLQTNIHKTKRYIHRKLYNLMSYLFRRYQKLPKTSRKNPFSEDNRGRKQVNDLYRDLSEQCESDHDEATVMKKSNAASERLTDYKAENVKKSEEEQRESKRGIYRKGDASRRRGHELGEKMKELEMMMMMMNGNDVDHVMDIEEALYLYSRLTCPVYLELLDNFFMDMYAEFFLPKPSITVNNSMRRLGPVKI